MNKKTWVILGLAVVALVVCAYSVVKTMSPQGDVQANVADMAKQIDNTKGNTPSVPPERLALGRGGAKK